MNEGIQTFTHTRISDYKCQGPYVAEWQQGAASWHPSFRSHRLRASQMSYVWLHGLRDAVDELHTQIHSRYVTPSDYSLVCCEYTMRISCIDQSRIC